MSNKRLMRSNNKVIAGVCGGAADYFGFGPTMTRLIYTLLTLFTAFTGDGVCHPWGFDAGEIIM